MTGGASVVDSIRPFYADWAGYNRRTAAALEGLTATDLALRSEGSDHWPIWAIAGHAAGTRIYWLCHVLGEPGAEGTPFSDGGLTGWEDDLSRPRTGAELAAAYGSTWRVVDGCLGRWTSATLAAATRREQVGRRAQLHSRQSVLLRMINHEAYHVGEISLILGANGREPIDLWPGSEWEVGAAASLREG